MKGPLLNRSIALVGMPGAGKTTVGRLLASKLGRAFVDTDERVEIAAGKSVAEIFSEDGEAQFRELEQAAIDAALNGAFKVVAAGGGAMTDPRSQALLLKRATTIWLDAAPVVLAQRLSTAPARPLLSGTDVEMKLAQMAAARRYDYSKALLRVSADDPPEVVLNRVLAALALL